MLGVIDLQLLDCLMEVGLTRHEAQLYMLLSSEGFMTGYEAAKLSGISRSNVYLALAGLVEKGGAMRIEGEVQRFAPVRAAEFCSNKRRRQELVLREILDKVPAPRESAEAFLTIKGKEHIVDKMKNLIDSATRRIYLSLARPEVEMVTAELRSALRRGLKVVLITDSAPDLSGLVVYRAAKQTGQIRIIADSKEVLTGEISEQDESSCLYSQNKALVTLFKEAMINEIRLIESGIITPETKLVR